MGVPGSKEDLDGCEKGLFDRQYCAHRQLDVISSAYMADHVAPERNRFAQARMKL